ncbi:AMP-binding protein [Aminobacter sp. LjRoot7]|uniref:AMP-binding protein n=1 Tax=Aminobacter sp. LjRoot7 TaxID=3342335 RepID=UPI003ECF491E
MSGHSDPRVPQSDSCVVRNLLDRRAEEYGEKIFATFNDDRVPCTYSQLRDKVIETANGLASVGVKQGDHVLVWLPNGELILQTLLGINYLGATFVPVNVAYKGRLLEHAIALSDAEVMVAHPALVPLLADIETAKLKKVIIAGNEAVTPIGDLEFHGEAVLASGNRTPPALDRPIEPWDIQCILYTSGTTGASKAVLCPYAHVAATGLNTYPYQGADDRGVIYMPLFHIGGFSFVAWAIQKGGSIALFNQFVTDTFWRDVRKTGGTFAIIMGAPATFLLKAERTEDEEKTPLRYAIMNPLTEEAKQLAKRVGFHPYGVFNMTETSSPLCTVLDPVPTNFCGTVRQGVECRVVDEHDCEVPRGKIGELIMRCDTPWAMNAGYYKNPEATATAWRNGWFHTGDAFRQDDEGNYYFVDRIKDSIRRRGENISSVEVEFEVNGHPDVKETAAVAVQSEFAEDEVMAVVRPVEGRTIDPEALLRYLLPRMPHYMVPRYIRIVEDFPRTPTQRVQKHLLRKDGVTADTWDREKAGITVKRQKLAS